MVFIDPFNIFSVISLLLVLLEYPAKTSHPWHVIDEMYNIKFCMEYTAPWAGFELTTLVVIVVDLVGSCKSTYDTVKTTTSLRQNRWFQLSYCEPSNNM